MKINTVFPIVTVYNEQDAITSFLESVLLKTRFPMKLP